MKMSDISLTEIRNKAIFEEIMATNFPELRRDSNPHLQEGEIQKGNPHVDSL